MACPKCGLDVPGGTPCGNCGAAPGWTGPQEASANLTSRQQGCLATGGLIGVIFIILVLFPGHKTSPDKKTDAILRCQDLVKDRVHSGSAQFSSASETEPEEFGAGFKITGWVDSRNGSGDPVRSHYICQVTPAGDADRWIVAVEQ